MWQFEHSEATRATPQQLWARYDPERAFTDVTRLPLARLEFAHRLEPVGGDRTRFTHRVTITGPLAPLFARVVGRNVAAGMPGAMRALATLAEQ